MNLFPIGEINGSDSTGSIDGITYNFFEPNKSSKSFRNYNNLVSLFQNQSKLTRKKAEPFLMITYNYENIFDREYRQIEHFIDYVEDSLTSFYTPDFSRGATPSNIALSGSDWEISITNTRIYSTITNVKADYAFVTNGTKWKLGRVISLSAGVSITMELTYGGLTLSEAQNNGCVYPLYCVYFTPNALSDFEVGDFVGVGNVTDSTDVGFVYSGTIGFNSKYSV